VINKYLVCLLFVLATTQLGVAQDSYANSVVSYVAGTGVALGYTNSNSVLGAPTQSAIISVPAYGVTNIVGVGNGGQLTVKFDSPITRNSTGHSFGMDFTVFGNEFFVLGSSTLSGIYNHPGLSVWVSQDNAFFYQLIAPDGLSHGPNELYPTAGSGNPLLPIDPTLSLSNFIGQTTTDALSLYNGSAGGASYSLSWAQNTQGITVDLPWISYIGIKGTSGFGYIDAIARVQDIPEPTAVTLLMLGFLFFVIFCKKKRNLLKKHCIPLLLATFLGVGTNLQASVTTEGPPRIINVGEANRQDANVSYLAFDESSLSNTAIIFAWHYLGTRNAQGSLWTGTDLLNGIIASTSGSNDALSFSTDPYGLITSYSIGIKTSEVVDPLASPVWTYWIQGGGEYVPYGDSGDFFFNVPTDAWTVSPGSSDTRFIINGSYDAWTISAFSYAGVASDMHYYTDLSGNTQPVTFGTYAGDQPLSKIAAIPEPSTGLFVLLFLMLFLLILGVKTFLAKTCSERLQLK